VGVAGGGPACVDGREGQGHNNDGREDREINDDDGKHKLRVWAKEEEVIVKKGGEGLDARGCGDGKVTKGL
jgi:hypothetical protein